MQTTNEMKSKFNLGEMYLPINKLDRIDYIGEKRKWRSGNDFWSCPEQIDFLEKLLEEGTRIGVFLEVCEYKDASHLIVGDFRHNVGRCESLWKIMTELCKKFGLLELCFQRWSGDGAIPVDDVWEAGETRIVFRGIELKKSTYCKIDKR